MEAPGLHDPALRTLPEALHSLSAGGGCFKATLWLHLLRICHIPARMRWVELDPSDVTRGLGDFSRLAGMPFFYPLIEVWLQGRWHAVDAYAMDPPLPGRLVQDVCARSRTAVQTVMPPDTSSTAPLT